MGRGVEAYTVGTEDFCRKASLYPPQWLASDKLIISQPIKE